MNGAARVPRVRTIIICDDVSASEIEEGVFNLEGVRQQLYAPSFPWRANLNVLLLLSSARKGKYPGWIEVVYDSGNRVIRHEKFTAEFEQDNESLSLPVEIANCVFPKPGQYTFQVNFSKPTGVPVLKGELPLDVFSHEE